MGARLTLTDGHAPITIEGGPLTAIDYTTPVPSAQVKTCVLLAGLQTAGTTTVRESVRTRDHSELALRAFGARAHAHIELRFHRRPADAARDRRHGAGRHLFGSVLSVRGGAVSRFGLVLDSLGLNPTRATLLDVLTALGAHISVLNLEEKQAELDRHGAGVRAGERAWALRRSAALSLRS